MKVEDFKEVLTEYGVPYIDWGIKRTIRKYERGFPMRMKDILNICDQLGIIHQKQNGFKNETLFYKDFYIGTIDAFGNDCFIYMSRIPNEITKNGFLDTKDKIIAALNFKIKSIKEYEVMKRQVELESDF